MTDILDMEGVRKLALEIHKIAKGTGWWDKERDILTTFMLVVSELGEATEDYRENGLDDTIHIEENGKPTGLVTELADVQIRLLDLIVGYGLLDAFLKALEVKINYNRTRPYRHGGKLA
jgi:NTP pyrophosphatase (non-canonical NTP hydrolase)